MIMSNKCHVEQAMLLSERTIQIYLHVNESLPRQMPTEFLSGSHIATKNFPLTS